MAPLRAHNSWPLLRHSLVFSVGSEKLRLGDDLIDLKHRLRKKLVQLCATAVMLLHSVAKGQA